MLRLQVIPHLYAVSAFLFFALMNVCVKLLEGDVPLSLVLTVRFWIGFWILLPLAHRTGGLYKTLKTKVIGQHFIRAITGMIAVGCSFYVLPHLPLADANALGQMYPFFLLLLSVPVLGEKIQSKQYLTCLLGFCGVLLIASPHGESGFISTIIIMISALAASISDLTVRKMSRTEKSSTIVLWFFMLAGLTSFIWWITTDRNTDLNYHQMGLLVMAGISGSFAQFALTEAFKRLDAGIMSPYSYLGFFFSACFGWIVFSDIPTLWMITGAAMIITAAQWNYRVSRSL